MHNSYTLRLIEITGLYPLEDSFELGLMLHNDHSSLERRVRIDESLYRSIEPCINTERENTRFRLSRNFRRVNESPLRMGTLSIIHCDTVRRFNFLCDLSFVEIIQNLSRETIPTDHASCLSTKPSIKEDAPQEKALPDLSSKKSRSSIFFGARIAAVSLVVLTLSIFGVNATVVNAPEEIEEAQSQELYGTAIFPTVDENERIFLKRLDPDSDQDPIAVIIETYVPPAPKEPFPVAILTSARNRTIGPGEVALTFDDGPSRFTSGILDVLSQYDVGATFFLVGSCIPENESLVQRIHQNGYSIGNHSYGHPPFVTLKKEQQLEEILLTNQRIEAITGEKVTLFRPPYGSMNNTTLQVVGESTMKIVLWNKDTEDWKVKNDQELVQYAKQQITGGSIVLFHEKQLTVDALPEIIEFIQNKGLKLVILQ